jgi:hypothetical protein
VPCDDESLSLGRCEDRFVALRIESTVERSRVIEAASLMIIQLNPVGVPILQHEEDPSTLDCGIGVWHFPADAEDEMAGPVVRNIPVRHLRWSGRVLRQVIFVDQAEIDIG